MTFFHVGDFGVGLEITYHSDEERLVKLNKVLKEFNCHLYVIRGNHDDPYFFIGNHNYSNLHLMEDYSIVEINGDKVLMVGGAISVDRNILKGRMRGYAAANSSKECYWYDEAFVLDESKLDNLYDIDYVVTHNSPSFTFPINDPSNINNSHGAFIEGFVNDGDNDLKNDLNNERLDLTKMYDILKMNGNPLKKWFCGHYHRHIEKNHNGVDFIILDKDEFYNITQIYL